MTARMILAIVARLAYRKSTSPRRSAGRPMLGALLALLAVGGALGVNGWHASMVDHRDSAVTAVSLVHNDADHGSASTELHDAAHALAGGWIAAPQADVPMLSAFDGASWSFGQRPPVAAAPPSAPLRPPIA